MPCFFSLPAEIRLLIYTHLLPPPSQIVRFGFQAQGEKIIGHPTAHPQRILEGISSALSVSRQFREEVVPLVFGREFVCGHHAFYLLRFLTKITPSNFRYIKKLDFGVDGTVPAICVMRVMGMLRARTNPLDCLTIRNRSFSVSWISEARRRGPKAMAVYVKFWEELGALDCINVLKLKFPVECVDVDGLDILARSTKCHWTQNS
jgi:hypothetical protein